MQTTVDMYLYAFGNAAQNPDCALGAAALKNAINHSAITKQLLWHPFLQVRRRGQQREALPDIATLTNILAQATQQSVLDKRFFITLGGDHSAAIGSWSGAAYGIRKDIGLIWFDAHMDSHTPQTSKSQNIHGMPLAVLLGHGEPVLTQMLSNKPKLKPENVVLIGVRSYEAGEAALLKKLGVKIFFMDDIKKQGLHAVIQESLTIVTRNTHHFGISIDLDGFDPRDAPGVGTPAPDGIRAADFMPEFQAIAHHPKLIGADIVEYNPLLDIDHKTEQLAVMLCHALMQIR